MQKQNSEYSTYIILQCIQNLKTEVYNQGSFVSETEWATFKCLFWNTNDSIVKLMVSLISGVSLWCRPCYKNLLNYDNNKCRKLTTTKK